MVKNSNGMKIVTVVPLKKGVFKTSLTYFTSQNIPDGSIISILLRRKKILGLVISSEDVSKAKSNIKDMSFSLKKITETKKHSIWRKEFLESAMDMGNFFVADKSDSIVSLMPSIFREKYDELSSFLDESAPWSDEQKSAHYPSRNIRTEKLLLQIPLKDRISFYKTLIRGSFASKKSVFMVLPTERDIEIFSESLSKGIENFTIPIHGGYSAKKIIQKYKQITSSTHPVLVLGTAPFLSIPRQDIKTIIVEHESSNAYKMIPRPHFDLRVFAEIFAVRIKAKFILADTLLRFETIERKDKEGVTPIIPLSFRIDFDGEINIFGKNSKKPDTHLQTTSEKASKFKILTDESIEKIHHKIKEGQNVFIFSLRKGLATYTVCRDCGESLTCAQCSAPVTLYLSKDGGKRMFVCNRCRKNIDPETVCRNCESWNLMPLGIGTDTVTEYIQEIFSASSKTEKAPKIFQLDKEKAKNAKGAEKIAKDFSAQGGSAQGGEDIGKILIGTEMAFFYLQNKVPLSILTSFDSLWSIPNFKMSEKIIQLVLSAISITKDNLLLETKNENDTVILAIKNGNLLSLVREELKDRENLHYPPYKRFIKITFLGDKLQTQKAREILEEIFREYNPEIFSGFVAKLQGKYVTNALIKIDPQKWSLPELSSGSSIDQNLLARLLSLLPSFDVFVDPEDLL